MLQGGLTIDPHRCDLAIFNLWLFADGHQIAVVDAGFHAVPLAGQRKRRAPLGGDAHHLLDVLFELLYPNINAERSRRKLTIEELAKALGVTRKTVYNWMVHGNIPQSKLEKMAEMFDCSIDYLLQRSI